MPARPKKSAKAKAEATKAKNRRDEEARLDAHSGASPKRDGPLLNAHPLADRLPRMSEPELEALRLSLLANGLLEKITLFQGKILDGRHRYQLCIANGIQPQFVEFKGDYAAAVEFVVSKAAHRNMSEGQKAWAAAQFAADLAKGRKPGPKDERESALISGKSSAMGGLRFGASPRNTESAMTLMAKSPSLFARLGEDRSYNVNRAMQEFRRSVRQRDTRKALKAAPRDMSDCDLRLGDCIAQMEDLDDRSVRLVFTDPPYNIGKEYHGDASGDLLAEADYLNWCRLWLAECARVLTDDGTIMVMINGLYAARMEMILRELELRRRNTIYWWENNPENQKGNFSDAVRVIHYFTRSNKFIFNDEHRVPSRRNQIADKRAIPEGKVPDNVWLDIRLTGNSLDRVPYADAPPQLPLAIPEAAVLFASEPGDVVLDPFNGNGITGIAALLHGRQYIGIEKSKLYHRQAQDWMAAQLNKLKSQPTEQA
jgi:adenine-specific DNA-methyltransferase